MACPRSCGARGARDVSRRRAPRRREVRPRRRSDGARALARPGRPLPDQRGRGRRAAAAQRAAPGRTAAPIVRFRGAVDGIEVFREQANVLLDSDGELVAIGGFVMGAPARTASPPQAPASRGGVAAASALADFGFAAAVAAQLRGKAKPTAATSRLALPRRHHRRRRRHARDAARVKRVWFRVGADARARVLRRSADARRRGTRHVDYYAYVVSAVDGRSCSATTRPRDVAFSYRVLRGSRRRPTCRGRAPAAATAFRIPPARPNGYQPPFVTPNLVTLRERAVQPERPVAAAGRHAHDRQQRRGVRGPGRRPTASARPTDECNVALPVTATCTRASTSANAFDYIYDHDSRRTPAARR